MPEHEWTTLTEVIRQETETGPTDETKHLRVRCGIYSMRNQSGRYTIRIRLPAGALLPEQLAVVAEIVERDSRMGVAHLTTRQGIEISDVPGERVAAIARQLEAAGLTTRRTGGNVVRGIVSCPWAGVASDEVFDVTPYALAVDQHLRDHPAFQRMPRKIKISFESCQHDHVRTAVADIGLRATVRDGQPGFRITVGGGLGAVPKLAQPLEDFTPVAAMLPSLDAILRVFDAHGNRQSRARARLKWLLTDWGIERFRDAVFAERASGQVAPVSVPDVLETPPADWPSIARSIIVNGFAEWRAGNVRPQKQAGYVAVLVRCPLGELSPAQLRRLAAAARMFSGGIRTTIEQDVLLRWVPAPALPDLYEFLRPEGLATCCAEQIMDITRCAGAERCLSAITNSKAAAKAIATVGANGLSHEPAVRSLRIRVSGCPNACSHHHAADIGLFGVSKKAHGRPAPHYALLLGGATTGHTFAQRIADVPACRVPEAVQRVLKLYLATRTSDEPFPAFVQRIGAPALRTALASLTPVPPPSTGPEYFRDLDATADFAVEAKEGECHF
ncbi:MAG: Sulfite reductase [ferredoxin] [Verrucomicrobiae bacterium]|nr:Sulfite reductase [ferredoxin] [Verrucomicrobiae bacterium]